MYVHTFSVNDVQYIASLTDLLELSKLYTSDRIIACMNFDLHVCIAWKGY